MTAPRRKHRNPLPKMKLYAATRKLLADTKIMQKHIAKDMGVTKVWLYKFQRHHMKDPGVEKTERLYTYLTGHKLQLVDPK